MLSGRACTFRGQPEDEGQLNKGGGRCCHPIEASRVVGEKAVVGGWEGGGGGGYMLDDGVGHGKLIKTHKEPHWLEVKDTATLSRYPLWVLARVWPLA